MPFRWPSLAHLSWVVVGGAVLLIAAFGALLWTSLAREYRAATDRALLTTENVARSVETHVSRTVLSIDSQLLSLSWLLDDAYGDKPLDGPEIHRLLQKLNDQTFLLRDLLILDETGRVMNSATVGPTERRIPGSEGILSAHRASRTPKLDIGHPYRNQLSGGWSVMMSRPFEARSGFRGIVVGEAPVEGFTDFFNALNLTGGVRIALLHADGTFIASDPHEERRVGVKYDRSPVFERLRLDRAGSGSEEANDLDPAPSFVSYRVVPVRPLIVRVAIERAHMLAGYYQERDDAVVRFALITLVVTLFTYGLVGSFQQQRRTEMALRQSEREQVAKSSLLQATLEHMGEGLSVVDRDGILVARNDRFAELLGLPATLARPGVSQGDVIAFLVERGEFGDRPSPEEVARQTGFLSENEPSEVERKTRDGRTLLIRRRPMPDGGFVSLYSNITERKRAEEQLFLAKEQAEIASRSKGEFLANMSHELRTPLNAIIGFSDMIRQQAMGRFENRHYEEYVNYIHTSGLHLLALINDVLDMSKLEAHKFELHEEAVALETVVAESVMMVAERARTDSITLTIDLTAAPPWLRADQRALKQIVINLLSNAVKFTDPGGQVSLAAVRRSDGDLEIRITDTGIGMSPDQLEIVVLPFTQIGGMRSERYGGTGLGLPISKRLIELHGGSLQLTSAVGVGTSATIRFPATRLIEDAPAAAADVPLQDVRSS